MRRAHRRLSRPMLPMTLLLLAPFAAAGGPQLDPRDDGFVAATFFPTALGTADSPLIVPGAGGRIRIDVMAFDRDASGAYRPYAHQQFGLAFYYGDIVDGVPRYNDGPGALRTGFRTGADGTATVFVAKERLQRFLGLTPNSFVVSVVDLRGCVGTAQPCRTSHHNMVTNALVAQGDPALADDLEVYDATTHLRFTSTSPVVVMDCDAYPAGPPGLGSNCHIGQPVAGA